MSPHRIVVPALIAAAVVAGLGACGAEPPSAAETEARGREETRGVRNTQAIGYSGEAVADKVDAALDAAEEHERRMREAEQDTP